jgi:uncharacterized membrane protein YozB (DUF420 family)
VASTNCLLESKGTLVLTAGNVILALKVAVGAVTVVLLLSLAALALGRYRLHGRLNLVFFGLTVTALILFEVVIRILDPGLFDTLKSDPHLYQRLQIHLCFAVPSALLMGVMLFTGLGRRRRAHLVVAWAFGTAWIGTFVTGIFFLPH